MSRVRITAQIQLATMMLGATLALGAGPLVPPEIVGMRVIGQMGGFYAAHTSGLLLNGNYLYCSTIFTDGLKTLDVSDPTNMVLTSEWCGNCGDGSGQSYGMAMKGTTLYFCDWAPAHGLRVFSISDPAHPSLIRSLGTTQGVSTFCWAPFVLGNLLFISVSDGLDPPSGTVGIDIWDISTASNPVKITFIGAPRRIVGSPVAAIGSDGKTYLYMTSINVLDVYNVTTPASPVFIRRITFDGNTTQNGIVLGPCDTTGTHKIKDGLLYMANGDDGYYGWYDGGVYVMSLATASNPTAIGYYRQDVFKDLGLFGRYCIIPHGSGPVLGLDTVNTPTLSFLWSQAMAWPNSGGTAAMGYPNCAAGAGEYAFVGTANSNGCTDTGDPDCGARVYAVRVEIPMPPIIKEVTPDPASIYAGQPYSKQLKLLQGDPLPTWSVVQGPPGTQVSGGGLVSGWTPAVSDIGSTVTFCIRATNSDGFDDECWQARIWSMADFDQDDDVDQEDFGAMQRCLSGAFDYPAGCGFFDFNQDGHVEDADMTVFMTCFGGVGHPPGC